MCVDRAESEDTITHQLTSIRDGQYARRSIALTQGLKRDIIPPFQFLGNTTLVDSVQMMESIIVYCCKYF